MSAPSQRTRPLLGHCASQLAQLESARLTLQTRLDGGRSWEDRNRLGQFATPAALANDIVTAAVALLDRRERLRFLDLAIGTGAFYSALLRVSARPLQAAAGFEIDPHYAVESRRLWSKTPLDLHIADFTAATPPHSEAEKSNLVICNPPYVRHHHLARSRKDRLQRGVTDLGTPLNGLSGLYCYFLVLSRVWMTRGGVAAWLVPSEFLDVNYGAAVKRFLRERVTLLRIHRFHAADVQFEDALVSSCVFFRNEPPPAGHCVEFTSGGPLSRPHTTERVVAECLRPVGKWARASRRNRRESRTSVGIKLGDLFEIKRGLATGCNDFFILSPVQARDLRIPRRFLKPILPSPRHLDVEEVEADSRGDPVVEPRRFLMECSLPPGELERECAALWDYLEAGRSQHIDQRYLCRHRRPWYLQEHRPPAPLLCTYMGRSHGKNGGPFRFILNHSRATAANVYLLLYPKPRPSGVLSCSPGLLRTIWMRLRSIGRGALVEEGRVYGGGLHKLEPRELANVRVDGVIQALEETQG